MLNVNYPYILKFRILAEPTRAYKNAEIYHSLSDAKAAFRRYANSDLQGVILILEKMSYIKHEHILYADNTIICTKKIPYKFHSITN